MTTTTEPRPRRRARGLTDSWIDALRRYEAQASGTASTVNVRMKRLRVMAGELGGEPGTATREDFEQWVSSLRCSLATAGEYVTAARAFYRWALRAGVAGESPVQESRVGRAYTISERWQDALSAFEVGQQGAGIAPGTRKRRLNHVRKFAASLDCGPWHVDTDTYLAWIERQAESTRPGHRDSLKAFYRWAHEGGRISNNIAGEVGKHGPRKLGAPQSWEADIAAWRRWLIGSGSAVSTVRQTIAILESFARAHASASPFDLTTDDLFDYMSGKVWGRETRRRFRAVVRSFYRWAVETGRTQHDPAELMPRVKAGDTNRTPATADEYRAALAATTDPRWQLALRIACELGLRAAEVAQCQVSDMRPDVDGGQWLTVRGKGGRVRRLPVPPGLAAAILARGDGPLFPSKGGKTITPHYLSKKVSQHLPVGVSMHALRHSFATRTYNATRDVLSVQRLLGHASPATTQRYVQVDDAALRALVEGAVL